MAHVVLRATSIPLPHQGNWLRALHSKCELIRIQRENASLWTCVLHLYLYSHMFSASLLDNKTLWLKTQIALVTSFNVGSFLVLNAMVRELKLGGGGKGETQVESPDLSLKMQKERSIWEKNWLAGAEESSAQGCLMRWFNSKEVLEHIWFERSSAKLVL